MKNSFGYHESSLLMPLCLRKQQSLPVSYRSFFLTFTDAVRSLFRTISLPPGAVILLPGFYCQETMSFFESFGKIVFYRINDDLTVNEESYRSQCAAHDPVVVVHYAFFGFPETLAREHSETSARLIIDDGAHRLLPPSSPPPPHTVYIDSARKRTTFLGSHVIGAEKSLEGSLVNWYGVRCTLLHIWYALLGCLSHFSTSKKIYSLFESAFEAFDGALGTGKNPTRGNILSYWLWNHLDFKKISCHTATLWQAYDEELSLLPKKFIYCPAQPSDRDTAYVPILLADEIREALIAFLENRSVHIYPLWDCPKRTDAEINKNLYHSLCALPLTWLTRQQDIRFFGRMCREFFTAYEEKKDSRFS
ncbi:hypothetical protein HY623_03155 [Candidatus Uhrbacteria bacterium]|nr:hypothetical protein [Candidatus Uhrbacteria bacterium]